MSANSVTNRLAYVTNTKKTVTNKSPKDDLLAKPLDINTEEIPDKYDAIKHEQYLKSNIEITEASFSLQASATLKHPKGFEFDNTYTNVTLPIDDFTVEIGSGDLQYHGVSFEDIEVSIQAKAEAYKNAMDTFLETVKNDHINPLETSLENRYESEISPILERIEDHAMTRAEFVKLVIADLKSQIQDLSPPDFSELFINTDEININNILEAISNDSVIPYALAVLGSDNYDQLDDILDKYNVTINELDDLEEDVKNSIKQELLTLIQPGDLSQVQEWLTDSYLEIYTTLVNITELAQTTVTELGIDLDDPLNSEICAGITIRDLLSTFDKMDILTEMSPQQSIHARAITTSINSFKAIIDGKPFSLHHIMESGYIVNGSANVGYSINEGSMSRLSHNLYNSLSTNTLPDLFTTDPGISASAELDYSFSEVYRRRIHCKYDNYLFGLSESTISTEHHNQRVSVESYFSSDDYSLNANLTHTTSKRRIELFEESMFFGKKIPFEINDIFKGDVTALRRINSRREIIDTHTTTQVYGSTIGLDEISFIDENNEYHSLTDSSSIRSLHSTKAQLEAGPIGAFGTYASHGHSFGGLIKSRYINGYYVDGKTKYPNYFDSYTNGPRAELLLTLFGGKNNAASNYIQEVVDYTIFDSSGVLVQDSFNRFMRNGHGIYALYQSYGDLEKLSGVVAFSNWYLGGGVLSSDHKEGFSADLGLYNFSLNAEYLTTTDSAPYIEQSYAFKALYHTTSNVYLGAALKIVGDDKSGQLELSYRF